MKLDEMKRDGRGIAVLEARRFGRVSGNAAAVLVMLVVLWWVVTAVLGPGARAGAGYDFRTIQGIYVLSLINVVVASFLQIVVIGSLGKLFLQRKNAVSLLGAVLATAYAGYLVVSTIIRILALNDAVASAAASSDIVLRLLVWGQAQPYAITFGLDGPGNALFAAFSVAAGLSLRRVAGTNKLLRWLLLSGGVLGGLGVAFAQVSHGAYVLALVGGAFLTLVWLALLPGLVQDAPFVSMAGGAGAQKETA